MDVPNNPQPFGTAKLFINLNLAQTGEIVIWEVVIIPRVGAVVAVP